MLEVGLADEKLVVLVGDISHFALQPFANACPGRFYNVGILESTIISMAAGLAHTGFFPVVHTIAPFIIERGFEQIKLDFCYQELGGTLIAVGSAFDYSGLGCSHYCYDDIALIKALPGSQIVYPAMPNEMNLLFKETYNNGKLTYFRLPARKHGIEIADERIRFGDALIVKEGRDVTVIGIGPHLRTAMESVTTLAARGIDAEVIYPHTIKPFDYELVRESVKKTRRYLVIEEHIKYGGAADEVLRACQGLDGVSGDAVTIPDAFCHGYGSYEDHCREFGLTPDNVVQKICDLCEK